MDNRAGSYKYFKPEIATWIFKNFKNDATILDVGAGSGTYYNLLGGWYKNMDAVEIYRPNIIDHKLEEKYRNVFNTNIVGFEYDHYNLIIFGDVLEHLTVEDAQKVLEYAFDRCDNLIVALPYLFKSCGNENKYEEHIQFDLTPGNIKERYPMIELLYGNNIYGYYIKRKI